MLKNVCLLDANRSKRKCRYGMRWAMCVIVIVFAVISASREDPQPVSIARIQIGRDGEAKKREDFRELPNPKRILVWLVHVPIGWSSICKGSFYFPSLHCLFVYKWFTTELNTNRLLISFIDENLILNNWLVLNGRHFYIRRIYLLTLMKII